MLVFYFQEIIKFQCFANHQILFPFTFSTTSQLFWKQGCTCWCITTVKWIALSLEHVFVSIFWCFFENTGSHQWTAEANHFWRCYTFVDGCSKSSVYRFLHLSGADGSTSNCILPHFFRHHFSQDFWRKFAWLFSSWTHLPNPQLHLCPADFKARLSTPSLSGCAFILMVLLALKRLPLNIISLRLPIIFLMDCVLYIMSKDCEKCSLYFPRGQREIFKLSSCPICPTNSPESA